MYQVTDAARSKLTLYAVRQRQRAAGMSDADLVAFWLMTNKEPLPSGVRDDQQYGGQQSSDSDSDAQRGSGESSEGDAEGDEQSESGDEQSESGDEQSESGDEQSESGDEQSESGDEQSDESKSDESIDPLLKALAEKIAQQAGKALDEKRVIELVKQHAPKVETRTIEIVQRDKPTVKIDSAHYAFDEALALVQVDPLMLVGPAGCGKTTLAEQLAKALGVPFAFTGALTQEFKLMGFLGADKTVARTPFRECYEFGGLFLFDEMDGSLPQPVLSFNAALANGHCDFPDAMIPRHPNFYAVAACNTWGRGADREYVGRYQQDGAALDRFSTLYLDYDEALETRLAGNADWSAKVQRIRAACLAQKVRHFVTPRASIRGAKLLAAGMSEERVLHAVVWKGLDANVIEKVRHAAQV